MRLTTVPLRALPLIGLFSGVMSLATEKAAVAQMFAFQDSAHQIRIYNNGTITATGFSMKAGTVPSLVPFQGGFVIGYHGTNGHFWLNTNGSSIDSNGTMAAGTSPSITVRSGQIAFGFRGANGRLWVSQGGLFNGVDTGGVMAGGTSPSVAGLPNGNLAIAFQGSNGRLWVSMTGPFGGYDTGGAMKSGTSPSIAATSSSQIYYRFHGANGNLWGGTGNGIGGSDTFRGMYPGSSPSVGVDVNNATYVALWTGTGSNAAIGAIRSNMGDTNYFLVIPYTRSPTMAVSGTSWVYGYKGSNGNLWTQDGFDTGVGMD